MEPIVRTDRNGRLRKGVKVIITNTLDCSVDQMWQRLQHVSALVEVCRPMARFTPRRGTLPSQWSEGTTYEFNLFLYGLLPVGKHVIHIERMTHETTCEIQSREYDAVVRVWNHLITISPQEDGRTRYTDEIELYAGVFTSLVAYWSACFYRHRQRKWRKVWKNSAN